MVVTNRYRTWEPWYASVVSSAPGAAAPFTVTPNHGTLAPRGGANNVCDETKPYADFASLRVAATAEVEAAMGAAAGAPAEAHLVVGTEEEQWTWELKLDVDYSD